MIHTPSGMPSELLDRREIEQRFKEVDLASARAKLKIEVKLAHDRPTVSRVRLAVRAEPN